MSFNGEKNGALKNTSWEGMKETLLPSRILHDRDPLALLELCGSPELCARQSPARLCERIQRMMELNPFSVHTIDAFGNTPLQAACGNHVLASDLKIIKLLIAASNALFVDSPYKALPGVPVRAQTPDGSLPEAFLPTTAVNVRAPSFGNELPLHIACKNGCASIEVVECLLKAYPAAVCARDRFNSNLPLHNACMAGAWKLVPLEVFIMLIQQWPDSVKCRNMDGNLPLHLAVSLLYPESNRRQSQSLLTGFGKEGGRYGMSKQVSLRSFSETDDESVSSVSTCWDTDTDNDDDDDDDSVISEMGELVGQSPSFFSSSEEKEFRQRQLEIVQLLVSYWPEALCVKNRFGLTPYHVAAASSRNSEHGKFYNHISYFLKNASKRYDLNRDDTKKHLERPGRRGRRSRIWK